jgi:hypothetical protein
MRLCVYLADQIETAGEPRPKIGKGWLDAARLMLDNDGRTEEQVRKAIDWAFADSFWCSNVLSMSKLRKQFGPMRIQATNRGHSNGAAANGQRPSTTDQRIAQGQAVKAALAARQGDNS